MKKLNIISLLLLLCLFACDNEDVNMPNADFTVSETTLSVNQTVTFTYTGTSAKQVVVYTGDAGHDYALKEESNSGFVLNKGTLTYSYKKPGVYKAVLVATNYDKEGKEIIFDTAEAQITVEDDRTDLRVVSLKKDIYNKEIRGEVIDNNILFAVPYKVRVNNRDIAVNIAQQRIELSAYSDAAKLTINGENYVANTKYNLNNPLAIKIISDAGDAREYNVVALRYPIFETYNINGVQGTVTYSDFDFDKVNISVTLPTATDVTALKPVFNSADAKNIKIGETEQVSGETSVDFTKPVTYVLKTWDAENEKISCETEITVTVILQ